MTVSSFSVLGRCTVGVIVAAALLHVTSAGAAPPGRQAAQTVQVEVRRDVSLGQSALRLGVTHAQYSLDSWGDDESVERGKRLLTDLGLLQNQHIYGWGTENINPAPGVYNWESLDRRMELIHETGGTAVITLCRAPDWMTSLSTETSEYQDIPPAREHFGDFAELAKQVALRYPDVRYFQVWNEFKGMWNAKGNNWDYRFYTDLYNMVYDALKSVNPALQVGGPYLVIEGTGSKRGGWAADPPISSRQWEVIRYWLKNKRGADFLCVDRGLKDFHDTTTYSLDESMDLTKYFGDITKTLREKTGLPVWWSEYYGDGAATKESAASMQACMLREMVLGGASAALLWEPQEGSIGQGLFTDTRKAGGGIPLPSYRVFQGFVRNFRAGAQLLQATSSSSDIVVLASDSAVMLANKRGKSIPVEVKGVGLQASVAVTLAPYEVRFM